AQGWSVKKMHRLMLTSAAYQQSTKAAPAAKEKDPDNHLLSHMNRVRVEGEVVRDSLLAVSGRLNLKMGGPGRFPPVPSDAAGEGGRGGGGGGRAAPKPSAPPRGCFLPPPPPHRALPFPGPVRPAGHHPQLPPPRTLDDRPTGAGAAQRPRRAGRGRSAGRAH